MKTCAATHDTGRSPVPLPQGKFIGQMRTSTLCRRVPRPVQLAQFEDNVKQDMELQRLQALITGGVSVSDNAVREAYRQQGTR